MQETFPTNVQNNSSSASTSSLTNNRQTLFSSSDYKIPQLPILDTMVKQVKAAQLLPDLSKTIIVGVQHILETTVTLFDALHEIGIKYENMYFSGKCYSTCPEIAAQVKKRGIKLMPNNKPDEPGEYTRYARLGIRRMWKIVLKEIRKKKIERVIILDDGARCLENMPETIALDCQVAAIEQTRAGLYSGSPDLLVFSLIEVATSAVKKYLEPPLIANAILRRFEALLSKLPIEENTVFGVVGNGAIGNGLCQHLLAKNYKVIVYDENESAFENIINKNFYRVDDIGRVFHGANIIFGCTGKDITEGINIPAIVKNNKILVSCTSEDKEFLSLLRMLNQQQVISTDTLSDIICLSQNGSTITILQGGFPFNFDRKPWNVPAEDIQVTQGLLLGGCLQAIFHATKPVKDGITKNKGNRQALDPFIQQFVALAWLKRNKDKNYPSALREAFTSIPWIQENSGGIPVTTPELQEILNFPQKQHSVYKAKF